VSERAATQEVAAERFVMVVIEQIRNIGPGCDVAGEPIAAVEIDDAVARNRTGIHPRQPGEPVHPAVPQREEDGATERQRLLHFGIGLALRSPG
jgi:hypothetical protein